MSVRAGARVCVGVCFCVSVYMCVLYGSRLYMCVWDFYVACAFLSLFLFVVWAVSFLLFCLCVFLSFVRVERYTVAC